MISFAKAKTPRRSVVNPSAEPTYTLAESHGRRFASTYRATIEDLRTPDAVRRMAQAVRNKSLVALDLAIPVYDPSNPDAAARWAKAAEDFEERYKALLQASGKKEMAKLNIPLSFNLRNEYSLPWIQSQAGGLIKDISMQTRQNIVKLINASFVDGIPPQTLARLIRSEIGLLPREAAAVDRRYLASIEQKIPAKQAIATSDRYAAKLLNDRAERIARTETIAAEAQGQLASWRVAQDEGFIVAGTRRRWISGTEEGGVCLECVLLGQDEPIPMGAAWRTSRGPIMGPPAHPNCRCTAALVPPED